MHKPEITWMLGSSRSGSSWLARLLAAQHGLVVINETHIGHHLGVRRPLSMAWSVGAEPPALTTLIERMGEHEDYIFATVRRARWIPTVRELLNLTIEDAVGRTGPPVDTETRVVIKEPSGGGVADLLFELTPEARLIFLVRDARDVVASWLAAYRADGWVLREGGFALADHGRPSFIRWQADLWAHRMRTVQAVYDGLPSDRRLMVRYEDLVRSPTQRLAEIITFLGAPLLQRNIELAVSSYSIGQVPSSERNDRTHIRNGVVGGWRNELTSAEQAALGERLSDVLLQYRYEV